MQDAVELQAARRALHACLLASHQPSCLQTLNVHAVADLSNSQCTVNWFLLRVAEVPVSTTACSGSRGL